jgi:hypothetical protein
MNDGNLSHEEGKMAFVLTSRQNQRTFILTISNHEVLFGGSPCVAMLLSKYCSIYCQKYSSNPFCSRNGSHNHGERVDDAALLCR